MPRFKVRESRGYTATYLVDAVDAEAAGRLDGKIVEEEGGDGGDYGIELLSVEEIEEEVDPPAAQVIDLMEALKASLKAAKR